MLSAFIVITVMIAVMLGFRQREYLVEQADKNVKKERIFDESMLQ